MKELNKALAVSDGVLAGPEREEALAAFHKQIEAWGVALPHVEPLIWHFGLNDFYKVGLIECWIANEMEAGYCAKYLFLFDGQTCPMHRHGTKVETFFVVKGKVSINCDGTVRELTAGDAFRVEAGKFHSFSGIGSALLLEVSMPCLVDDNYFEDPQIPYGGNYRGGPAE